MQTETAAEREEEKLAAPETREKCLPGRRRRPGIFTQEFRAAALVGLASLFVYWRTLSVSIAWGDSPELTSAAFSAGVPHPTGYPLYMLISHAFLRFIPLGSVAYRMNLLSAISAALAIAHLYPVTRRFARSRAASLAATLLFAFSPTFWSQAVIAEVYAFHMLGMVAVVSCVLAWDARGEQRWLRAAALVYGLCLTHHMLSLLLFPGLLFFALTSKHRAQFLRELRWTVPLFLLPLSLYAYLPLAARRDPPLNWGDPRTWDNFLAHVTGRQYHPAMFKLSHAQLWAHVRDYTGLGLKGGAGHLLRQFTPWFLLLAPVGLWSLARRQWRLAGLTVLVYLVDLIYALNYYIYDVDIYYLPSHLMLALWIGCGLRQVGFWLGRLGRRLKLAPAKRRPLKRVLGSALLGLPLMLLWGNWRENDHHQDWNALMYARAALETLKPHAVLLTGGDNYYFPLLYTRYVEHLRPDVTMLSYYDAVRPERMRLITRLRAEGLIVNVPPSFKRRPPGLGQDNALLKRVVEENIGRRPLYVLGPAESLRTPWLAEIVAPYYRIVTSNVPSMELSRHAPEMAVAHPHPERQRRVTFGLRRPDGGVENDLQLLGYDVQPLEKGGVPWLRMSYYWRINNQAAARPAMVWVLFTDAAGNYRRKSDGSPEFHNIHPLAYGAGQGPQLLPRTLRETFDLYVPPEQWNKTLHMRIAVALGSTFLPNGPGRSPWVEMGALPAAPVGRPSLHVTRAEGE